MEFSWERLKPVLDHAPVVVFARDVEGRYLYVNLAFEELIGKRAEEILGRTPEEVLPPEVAGTIRDSDREAIDAGQGVVVEAVAVYGGARRTIMNFKFPLPGADGKPAAVMGFGTDVSERRRREGGLPAGPLPRSGAEGGGGFPELTRHPPVLFKLRRALLRRFHDQKPTPGRTPRGVGRRP